MATDGVGKTWKKISVYTNGSAAVSSFKEIQPCLQLWGLGLETGERSELSTVVTGVIFLATIYGFFILYIDDNFSRLAVYFVPRATIII